MPGGPFDGAGYAGRCAAADSDDAIAKALSIPDFTSFVCAGLPFVALVFWTLCKRER